MASWWDCCFATVETALGEHDARLAFRRLPTEIGDGLYCEDRVLAAVTATFSCRAHCGPTPAPELPAEPLASVDRLVACRYRNKIYL